MKIPPPQVQKSERLWAIRIHVRDPGGLSLLGACSQWPEVALWAARLFRTRVAARAWVCEQSEYFQRAYRPRVVRVRVDVIEER